MGRFPQQGFYENLTRPLFFRKQQMRMMVDAKNVITTRKVMHNSVSVTIVHQVVAALEVRIQSLVGLLNF